MKRLFKLSGFLKILFLINIFFIEKYKEILLENHKNNWLGMESIQLNFPWYADVFGIIVAVSYILHVIILHLFSYKPCWSVSQYFHHLTQSRVLYGMEIFLLIAGFCIGYTELQHAFFPNNNMLGLFTTFLDPARANNLQLIAKLNVINTSLLLVASIITLTTFWKIRAKNLIKCKKTVSGR